MKTDRPNILLVMSDQHNARCLGCAGEPLLSTPNLDRLASEGVRFTNAFANSIHCGPSRVSFLTGMYEHSHLRHKNTDEPPDHLNPLTGLLRAQGYQTALIGKGHLGVRWPRREFDHTRLDILTDAFPDDPLSCDYFRYLVEQGQADNFDLSRKYTYTDDPARRSPLPFEHSEEVWVGNETLEYLRGRDRSRPFFLFASFQRPHNPLTVSAPYDTLYDPSDVVLPSSAGDTFETKSERQKRGAAGQMRYPFRPPTEEYLRKCMAYYYALVTIIDMQIGRMIKALEDEGALDNTIVIYTADHGDFAAEHGFMYKNLGFYDCLHRIPWIMRYPGTLPAGECFEGCVESVDLYPTLTDMLGLQNPWTVQGRSFAEAANGAAKWTKQSSLAEHVKSYHHMSLRTADHRITVDAKGTEHELYDYRLDPDELVNRWDDPGCRELRERLMLDMLRFRACPDLLFGP